MDNKNNIVIVNATALRIGGGLIILNQFINAIPKDKFIYYIFVDNECFNTDKISKRNNSHIIFIPLEKRSFFNRFLWDSFGLKQYLKKHNITPKIAVSLQNTNFRLNKNIPNFIYFHQFLSLTGQKWSITSSKERTFWFYKNIYPYFVKLFINKKTEVFVQQEFIKKAFSEKLNFPENKIHVVFPNIEISKSEIFPSITINSKKFNLIYPAIPFKYKNHQLLFDALFQIDNSLTRNIVLYLTCDKRDIDILYSYKNIEIVFLGQIIHPNIIWFFSKVDMLVFPSYIETLGLPLIEAASQGLAILTVDLPYANEVLKGYKGATFINYQDVKSWGSEILAHNIVPTERFSPYQKKGINSWDYFFEIIKRKI